MARLLLLTVFALALFLLLHFGISLRVPLLTVGETGLSGSDFAFHVLLAKGFWFRGLGHLYDTAAQQAFWAEELRRDFSFNWILGFTPVALLLWLPFGFVAQSNLPASLSVANSLWLTLSLSVFFYGVWKILYVLRGQLSRAVVIAFLLLVFSRTLFIALLLGQSTVLCVGVLLILLAGVTTGVTSSEKHSDIEAALCLLILAIKPQYFLLGAVLLLFSERKRALVLGVGVITFVLLLLTPRLGVFWAWEYLAGISHFSASELGSTFRGSYAPEGMRVFRSAASAFMGDARAVGVSKILGLVFLVAVGVLGRERLAWPKTRAGYFIAGLILTYLLFTPYAGLYEDLLFIVAFAAGAFVINGEPRRELVFICAAMLVAIGMNVNTLDTTLPLWLLWEVRFVGCCGLVMGMRGIERG